MPIGSTSVANIQGEPGPPGPGLPLGGATADLLAKASGADLDTVWQPAGGLFATTAQGALADTALQPGAQIPWSDVTGKPTFFSGAYADLTGKPTLGTASAAAVGDFATAAQGTLASSALQPGAVIPWADVSGKPSTFTPSAHVHAIADVTNLQAALDGKQPLATVLTNTTAAFTTAQEAKLAGIASGATVNSSDATLLSRANHTGTQTASTISDFASAVAATAAVTANTAKVTNATHTGDVTGATALTIANDAVTNAKMANMAANTIKGAVSAGDPVDLTATQVRTMINVADGATANAADAALRDRATHTGTQAIATVSGLQSALDGKQPSGSYATAAQGALADTAVQPAALSSKQDTLVSGNNIKTVNGNSLLGSGDLVISGGGGGSSPILSWAV